jgi:putative phosphoribosyl transferase
LIFVNIRSISKAVEFASRADAGQQLGRRLQEIGVKADIVIGLPRGGVVVAAEVARVLLLPLDVLIVRKIGHPLHREFAVGALGEGGVVVLDEGVIGPNPRIRAELATVIEEETQRLQSYQTRFHHAGVSLADKAILLIDDGLATGATTEAAVLSARRQGARSVIVAAPIASTNAVERLQRVAEQVVVLFTDPEFDAVGRYYEVFSQTSDEEVIELLKAA